MMYTYDGIIVASDLEQDAEAHGIPPAGMAEAGVSFPHASEWKAQTGPGRRPLPKTGASASNVGFLRGCCDINGLA